MTNIDQFESVFKSAAKTTFQTEEVSFEDCLLVTDLDANDASVFLEQAKTFLERATRHPSSWKMLGRSALNSIDGLLTEIQNARPDLICTYRNLLKPAIEHPYSLGVHLDVMTQAIDIPVLVVGNPHHDRRSFPEEEKHVMAITDHLIGQHHLINVALAVTPDDGTLWLTHVEDEVVFDRYMETISKIPEIDTDSARKLILEKLLSEPSDYIDSCRQVVGESNAKPTIEKLVTVGHHLTQYKSLIAEHHVDLLVLNTKDEDQLAMHGLAYPLSVELRDVPMLLL